MLRPGRGYRHLLALLLALAVSACPLGPPDKLRAVKSAGELVVLTQVGPTTWFESPEGPAGFEHDLARAFAEHLGVRLRLVPVERFGEILPRLARGEGDLAAAGIAITEPRRALVRFSPPYQEVRQQVVYRLGATRPDDVAGLVGRHIEIPAGSNHAERLAELRAAHPRLAWTEVGDKKTGDLLQNVWEGLLDVTVADSHVVTVNRQHFPELQIAFDLSGPQGLAWAFAPGPDDSLARAAAGFLDKSRASGELASLIERYYGPASRSSYVNLTVYHARLQSRLPLYQQLFEQAARRYRLDWRLLAAIAYQESYLDPEAVSPTGVRGIMMLTEETAAQLGVNDRLDPAQSIDGGARYVSQMIDRVPDVIVEPDRLWFALAAYNVGIHHVEDARIITQKQGADPNKWNDVKDRLPLLATKKWAERAKYGHARGYEAVVFVNRIRTYYDILVKLDEEQRARRRSQALTLKAPAL